LRQISIPAWVAVAVLCSVQLACHDQVAVRQANLTPDEADASPDPDVADTAASDVPAPPVDVSSADAQVEEVAATASIPCLLDSECTIAATPPCTIPVCDAIQRACIFHAMAAGSACSDGNPCTSGDSCLPGGFCSGTAVADGAACEDGTPCTTGDHCTGAACVGLQAVCEDGIACTMDFCDSLTGACQHVPTGGPCDDGDACTTGDVCLGGGCAGVYQDCGDGDACTVDLCQGGACQHEPTQGPCSDGNACTTGDSCASGTCQSSGLAVCDDGHVCTQDTCDPVQGCVHAAGPIGVPCGEGEICLGDGACVLNVACQGMPALCDDHESCTLEFCDPGAGCIYMPADDNIHCDDDDNCTPMASDKCHDGKCQNPVNLCGCTTDAECAKFDDGDLCNGQYACLPKDGAKKCAPKPNSAIICPPPPSSACKRTVCQPETGTCLADMQADGVWCEDGNPCTASSSCSGGKCVGGVAQTCDDGVACTTDTCVAAVGCKHEGSACSQACGNCDDGNPCTTDRCEPGGACSHVPVDCSSAGNACLVGTCAATGATTYACNVVPKPSKPVLAKSVACNGLAAASQCPVGYTCIQPDDDPSAGSCQPVTTVSCDDGNACTIGDACDMGACVAGPPAGCVDEDPCTQDSCGAGGCVHTKIPGCVACAQEPFAGDDLPTTWATWSAVDSYVRWQFQPDGTGNSRMIATWKGPLKDDGGTVNAYLMMRRFFFAPGVTPHLDFRYRAKLGSMTCGTDDLMVVANGQMMWRACDNSPKTPATGGWVHVEVDLSAWAGAPVDLDFRAVAGPQAQAFGSVEVDDVRVTGACTTACVGGDFENRSDARILPSSPVPLAWQFTSSNADYASWQRTQTGGHTGIGAYSVDYKGAPANGQAVTVRFTMPQVLAAVGSQLRFATRAVQVDDPSCQADVLTVKVGGEVVHQLCKQQSGWQLHAVDLTPYAGQDVAVTFEVVTGAKASTRGLFQIDDIAVTGECSYACFRATFEEPGGIGLWWHGESSAAPPFALKSDAISGAYSVGVDFPADAPEGSIATLMPQDKWRWVMPVMGATLSLHAKLELAGKPCPFQPLRLRMVYGYRGIQPTNPKEALESPFMTDVMDECQDTQGWQTWTTDFGDPARGRKFQPMFVFRKPAGSAKASLRVDDLLIRCH
jgi:hypothetical protein